MSRIGKSRRPNRAAFTLIELILVILIISILISLSSPLLKKRFSDLELQNTTFNLSGTINYAQEMAIVEKANYRLNFDFDKGRYWITKLGSTDDTDLYKRIGGRYGKVFFIPKGLTLSGKDNEITLYPDGRSSRAEIKIISKDRQGSVLRVKGFGSNVEIADIKDDDKK